MTLTRALALILGNLLLVFGLGFRVLVPLVAPNPENPFAPSWFSFSFVIAANLVAALGLVWYGSVRQCGRSWAQAGWHSTRWSRRVLAGVLGGLLALGGLITIRVLMGDTVSGCLHAMREVDLPSRLVFLCIGLGAGFIEETLFRGNLQGVLEPKWGRATAIALTSMVFALYHLNFSLPSLGGKLVVGTVCGVLKARDGSLLGSGTAHALVWLFAGQL